MKEAKIKEARTGARAVKTSEKEVQEIITSKKVEALNRQKDFRSKFLNRLFQQETMKAIVEQIKSGNITMEAEGLVYTKEMLVVRYQIELHNYKLLIAEEEHYKKALLVDGYSMEEIMEIADGKFKKSPAKKK